MSIVNLEGLTLFGEGSEWFWVMAQFVIVAITLAGIYAQLKVARNANAFEQANALSEEWLTERLARRRLTILGTIAENGPEADLLALFGAVGNYWENVAALVRRGHIDLRVVYENFSSWALPWWSLLEPAIRQAQLEQDPTIMEHFEWLVGEFVRLDRANGVPEAAWTRDAVVARLPNMIAREQAGIAEFEAMRTVIVASATPAAPAVVVAAPATDPVGDTAN